jgi:dolichol-phosphate mannosyltransferase
MDNREILITAIVPALNEEKNILPTINNILEAFKDFQIEGEIIIVDDGSSDKTGEIMLDFMKRNEGRLRMLRHESPEGVGASFWDGVDNAHGRIIVMLPGDNENDPWEIFRYFQLLDHVDMVIPFIFNKQVRSFFRRALSYVYRFIINTTFLVSFNYTNGTAMYRRSILKELNYRSNGFFFQTDILIRMVKKGYLFAEVPYRLGLRASGVSKAVSFPSLVQVIRGYFRLLRDYYFIRCRRARTFSSDSVSGKRYT